MRLRACLAQLALWQVAAELECLCKFAANATFNVQPWQLPDLSAPGAPEPLWVCAGGVRQYRCLQKWRRSRHDVARGEAGDRRAPDAFCDGMRAADPCAELESRGFAIFLPPHGFKSVKNLTVELLCPNSIDCSNATGYLTVGDASTDDLCAAGPYLNESNDTYAWITETPFMEISSPSHADIYYAEPFGFIVYMYKDLIMDASPYFSRLQVFRKRTDGSELWETHPTAIYQYPDQRYFARSRRLLHLGGMDGGGPPAFIFAGTFKPALNFGAPAEEIAEWQAWNAQKVYVFTLGDDGIWKDQPHVLEPPSEEEAGFGVSVGGVLELAIVGTTRQRVYFYVYSGEWFGPVTQIEKIGTPSFGQMVAMTSSRGKTTAIVGCPDEGLLIFYDLEDTSFVEGVTFGAEIPLGDGFPSEIATSGRYVLAAALSAETVYVYEREADAHAWTQSLLLEASSLGMAGTDFGRSIAVDDRTDLAVSVVVGASKGRRALLVRRVKGSTEWEEPEELFVSGGQPFGFGRAVAAYNNTIAVGSDARKVFLYTEQLLGVQNSTPASQFIRGSDARHRLTFDARRLIIGNSHALCVDLDGESNLSSTSTTNETYKDWGLYNIRIVKGHRSQEAEWKNQTPREASSEAPRLLSTDGEL